MKFIQHNTAISQANSPLAVSLSRYTGTSTLIGPDGVYTLTWKDGKLIKKVKQEKRNDE